MASLLNRLPMPRLIMPRKPSLRLRAPRRTPKEPIPQTVQELAEEARAMRPLLKAKGIYDAAIFHPGLCHLQYTRVTQFAAGLGILSWVIMGLTLLGVAGGFALMLFAFAPTGGGGVAAAAELNQRVTYTIVGAIMGAFFGALVSWSVKAVYEFGVVYADGLILQVVNVGGDDGTSRQKVVVAALVLPLMRMAFVDRMQEDLFSGPKGKDGFQKGRLVLETEKDVAQVSHPSEVYDAVKCRSNFTGVHAVRTYTLLEKAVRCGQVRRAMLEKTNSRSRGNLITGNAGITLGLAGIVVMFLVMALGIEVQGVGEGLAKAIP